MSSSSPKTVVPRTYKEQPFDLYGLDGISDPQITEHLALYAGYVKQVNGLNEDARGHDRTRAGVGQEPGIRRADASAGLRIQRDAPARALLLEPPAGRRAESAEWLRPGGGSGRVLRLRRAWQAAFHAIGELRGVGWVILFQDPTTHWLTNHWITLHQEGVPAGFKPTPGDGCVGARVHAGLQGHGTGHVHRGFLPEHRLAEDRGGSGEERSPSTRVDVRSARRRSRLLPVDGGLRRGGESAAARAASGHARKAGPSASRRWSSRPRRFLQRLPLPPRPRRNLRRRRAPFKARGRRSRRRRWTWHLWSSDSGTPRPSACSPRSR